MTDMSSKGGCSLYEAGFDDADGEDVAVVVYALLLADDTGGVMQTKDRDEFKSRVEIFSMLSREDQRVRRCPSY